MLQMELFESKDHYILQWGEHSLWCGRKDGSIVAKRGEEICTAWNPVCLGLVYGVIGKMKIHPEMEPKLLLIRQREEVGTLPGPRKIYKITKIVVLPLSEESPKDMDIEMCQKHHFGIKKSSEITRIPEGQQKPLQKTWNSLKSAAESVKPKKMPVFKMPDLGELVTPLPQDQKELKEKERFERKITEEVLKMFQETGSFFYCPNGDITNCIQRQHCHDNDNVNNSSSHDSRNANNVSSYDNSDIKDSRNRDAPWKHANDTFFWNKHMLQDLIDSQDPLADVWIVPIIQGYVHIQMCRLTFEDQYSNLHDVRADSPAYQAIEYKLCLVSRRSRYRAGTRYKRRGVDEEGKCANFVETEQSNAATLQQRLAAFSHHDTIFGKDVEFCFQILEFSNHVVSFVQTRGSVPLYWSQTGIKYKPPPRIEKDLEENHEAFSKHVEEQVASYQHVAIVSLLDLIGKEKVVADAFLQHTVKYDSPHVTYIAFDFHDYCRGMKFENVSVLTESILDEIKHMRYCWVDNNGMICDQRGVFRVNCLDCLDRTNVVQSAIARLVLEIQSRKLGLLPPDESLPASSRLVYQQMWANNGDAISRQYAGTAALKGDFTRTGERRITGMMKDGVNSANRYYINKVKDAYKQTAIDLLLGNPITEDLSALRSVKAETGEDSESGLVEKEQNLKVLIDECKKMLVTEPEACLGGWGLIDCDPVTGDPTRQDMDIILLLSQRAYYVARYDDEADVVTSYQKIYLEDLERIEIGPSPAMFKSKHVCIRIFYARDEEPGYFHTFRTTGTRLFNNIVIYITNEEEAKESLRAIYESFAAARKLMSQELKVTENKLDRKRSKVHADIIDIASQAQEKADILPKPSAMAQVSSQNNLAALQTVSDNTSKSEAGDNRRSSEPGKHSTASSPTSPAHSSESTSSGEGQLISAQPSRNSSANTLSSVAKATKSSAQRGMTNFTKTLSKLKPTVRVPGKPKANLVPAVWYSKDEEENKVENDVVQPERARILKGTRIAQISKSPASNSENPLVRNPSQNKKKENENLLIDLGVNPPNQAETKELNPVLAHTIRDETDRNADLLIDISQSDEGQNDAILIDFSCQPINIEPVVPKAAFTNQRSVDSSTVRPELSHAVQVRTGALHLQSCGMLSVQSQHAHIIPERISLPPMSAAKLREYIEENPLLKDMKAGFYIGQKEASRHQATGRGADGGVDQSDEWVNVDVFDDTHADVNLLKAPRALRGSHSDSALNQVTDRVKMEELVVSAEHLQRGDVMSAAAAFSRMRMRMSALTTPIGGYSPHTRRKALMHMAQENKQKSQHLFKHSKSKVILL